jgi:hypothetical protein
LTFAFPEVLNVITLCTSNAIAVLGIEMFVVKSDGFYALGYSDYDLHIDKDWNKRALSEWSAYVAMNNALAEQSVAKHPRGDDHVYMLTTASLEEYRNLNRKPS